MHPKSLLISDFTYNLPPDKIAKFPLKERADSKLLVFEKGEITDSVYQNITEFLPGDTLLIFNNTKVVEARLLFEKPTGGVIEVFCLEPAGEYPDVSTAMMQKEKVRWKCLIGGAGKWKHGVSLQKKIKTNEEEFFLQATIAERLDGYFVIELSWQPVELSFAAMLYFAGLTPLPPYLQRNAQEDDKDRYQTIYARHKGSVAAPTAGLHFTEKIFEKLTAKNIHHQFVTLHVGAGTFKPVKSEKMAGHEMHAEFIEISENAIQNLLNHLDKTIVAVGTTSLRTIESLYWMGAKLTAQPDAKPDEIIVRQWDPYEMKHEDITAKEALKSVRQWMIKNHLTRLITKTQILIAPGYKLKVAKGIITNFHQPQSTLLLLIAAIVGDEWRNIYNYALNNDFRFLSYGDGCLLWSQ